MRRPIMQTHAGESGGAGGKHPRAGRREHVFELCYHTDMTREQIDAVLERVRSWPQPRQEEAIEILLAYEAEGGGEYLLSEDDRTDLTLALEEVARGEIATADEINAVFGRHRG